ncbi:isochorismatase family protein [Draconibacterium sp.]|nr:isochorismatase family protein [Draconibacterium sp.]
MTMNKKILKKIIFGIIGVIILFILIVVMNLVVLFKNESIVSKGQPIQNYGKKNYALLVVDIQEVITGSHSIFPRLQDKSENLIQKINQAIDSFEMHSYPVVYIRSEITNPFINLINSSYAKGSPGVQYDKRLKIVSNLEVVKTGKDSYRKTNLDDILTGNKVNELYIVGLDAAECVNVTVEASQNRHYNVNIIKEAVISKSERKTDSMMMKFKEMGVKVISMDSLNIMKYTNAQSSRPPRQQ